MASIEYAGLLTVVESNPVYHMSVCVSSPLSEFCHLDCAVRVVLRHRKREQLLAHEMCLLRRLFIKESTLSIIFVIAVAGGIRVRAI